jgi:hypothetical protein
VAGEDEAMTKGHKICASFQRASAPFGSTAAAQDTTRVPMKGASSIDFMGADIMTGTFYEANADSPRNRKPIPGL